MKLMIGFLLLLSFSLLAGGNERVSSFSKAKKFAAAIHDENPYTIYCHCKYYGKTVDLESCGYKAAGNGKRAGRVEWEHVVPAAAFGRSFIEWTEGVPECYSESKKKIYKGRKCAEKNPLFARMEADLYNLWPEDGELNGLRSNFDMAELATTDHDFGGCKAKISDQKFEPMDFAKGIVARTYMYMEMSYPDRGVLTEDNKKLFESWDRLYPVSDWECLRAEKIEKIQGNINEVLKERCAKR